ncbi:Gfo/Idh/MocA family protein [Trichococcus ilyis]|uniref:Predicted dehydrogenase n=1 Tax=Trichococcus ilyis TaxID=640938 RepID=A0A143ZAT3_9LACT|nr:Gfo/Idh/MocA family oxidoreductase [Trichococcus ilyis]CZR10137.1 Hypothetical protein TR210_2866 [Trichococcus ilyis]SEJ92357.1 Predicted dehydrogenase [Trichococcus ilyis]
MEKIKFGIIGLGFIANKFAETVNAMDSVELAAVADRDKDSAEAFGKRYDVPTDKCYASPEELVRDESVDVVYVAVPHVFHKDISLICLENGKGVLCEKPVAITAAEIKEMIAAAERNQVFFMEAMKTRFLPVNQKVKQWIDAGEIGEVRLLQADFGFKAPLDPESRLFNKELGGGALLDVGVYNLSYSTFILGNAPEFITANLYIGETGVDENVGINLAYPGGKQAQLYGAINLNTVRDATIVGTKGRITVPRFSNAETATLFKDGKEETFHLPFGITGFEYQIEEVVNCLNNGKLQSEIMSWEDSIKTMEILDSVRNDGNQSFYRK